MKKLLVALILCLSLSAVMAQTCNPKRTPTGKISRSTLVVKNFKLSHPCPANGKTSGSCPGYIVDHIKPLCACGSDTVTNMQWQTKKDSLLKDKEEMKLCRSIK